MSASKHDRALYVWFVFGVGSDGLVDIADQDGDIITDVPPEAAARIVAARSRFVADVTGILIGDYRRSEEAE